jgi:hypothetical protein
VTLACAFSADGTLVASGCSERLLTVSDASRPHLGPLVQVRGTHAHVLPALSLFCPTHGLPLRLSRSIHPRALLLLVWVQPPPVPTCSRTTARLASPRQCPVTGCHCVHRVVLSFCLTPPPFLHQFLAYGDVTAVGFGPGLLPWPELLEESEDGVARLSFKHWNEEALPRCGDGHGNVGT